MTQNISQPVTQGKRKMSTFKKILIALVCVVVAVYAASFIGVAVYIAGQTEDSATEGYTRFTDYERYSVDFPDGWQKDYLKPSYTFGNPVIPEGAAFADRLIVGYSNGNPVSTKNPAFLKEYVDEYIVGRTAAIVDFSGEITGEAVVDGHTAIVLATRFMHEETGGTIATQTAFAHIGRTIIVIQYSHDAAVAGDMSVFDHALESFDFLGWDGTLSYELGEQ